MNRFLSRRPFASVLSAAVAVVILSVLAPAHAAAARPYASRRSAQFVSATEFVGTGNATHLGRYTEAGSVQFTPTNVPGVLQLNAVSTYTAANGDELHAVFTGQLNALTGVITATATYVGGTGRFADATGTAALSGQLLGGGAIQVAVTGDVEY